MNPFPLLLADLKRHRLSLGAVVLLIAVAVALGVAVSASARALRQGSTDAAFAGRWGKLPVADGRMFQRRDEVVVGAGIAWPLGTQFHPSHGLHHAIEDDDDAAAHQHQDLTYTVVGRLAAQGTPWDRAILAPIESVWWVHGLADGHPAGAPDTRLGAPWDPESLSGVPALVVKPRSIADAYRLRDRYRRNGTMALFPAEVLIGLYATLGDARDLIAVIALGTQILVVAAVLLAVLATLATRRRQLAVLRALGASRRFLFGLIWLQVESLVLAGGLTGLALGWVAATAVARIFTARTGIALPVEIGAPEALLVGGLVAAGALLAIVPAWSAYRTPVSTALRG